MSPALFLLDLDGLLVRTEELHCAAYREMCARRGERLDWSFERYCLAAHYGPEHLRQELAVALPGLFADGTSWDLLHREKRDLYAALLARTEVELQPGVAELLHKVRERGASAVVVTNSPRAACATLAARLPPLAAVDGWVCREDYERPKPAPDAYRTALARWGVAAAAAVGLEDTPRGVEALVAAGVSARLVSAVAYPADSQAMRTVRRYPSLPALLAAELAGAPLDAVADGGIR